MSKNQIKISKADAKKEIEGQFEKGRALWRAGESVLHLRFSHDDQRVRARDNFVIRYNQWRDLTREVLRKVFVSTSYVDEFSGVTSSKSESVGPGWVPDVKYFMQKEIIPKNDYLKILLESIDEFTELADEENQPTPSLPTDDDLDLPAEITLEWLWKHVPVYFWRWLLGILIAVFLFGITVGKLL